MKLNQAIADAVLTVLEGEHKTVVAFPDRAKPTLRVRATLHGKKVGRDNTVHVTVGRPNYEEREFLRQCRKALTKPRYLWFPRG